MEWLIPWATENAHNAHFLLFGLLMLAGFNLPVSEDLVIITGGVLASTVIPEHSLQLFMWIFMGAYVSDWVAYWIGRLLGPRVFQLRMLRGTATPERLATIEGFYDKYGVRALLLGRFIPFGVRNCLFMAAGMGRMPFTRFVLADGIACLCSNALLFSLAYSFGRNYGELYAWVSMANWVIFAVALASVGALVGAWLWRRRAY